MDNTTKSVSLKKVESPSSSKSEYFEIKYEVTEEIHKDWALHPLQTPARKKKIMRDILFCVVWLILWIGLSIVEFTLGATLFWILCFIISIADIVYKELISPRQNIKRAYQQALSQCENHIWLRTVIFDDDITIIEGPMKKIFYYSQIKTITEYNNYFYLWIAPGAYIYVKMDAFKVGNAETFRQFINSKIASSQKAE